MSTNFLTLTYFFLLVSNSQNVAWLGSADGFLYQVGSFSVGGLQSAAKYDGPINQLFQEFLYQQLFILRNDGDVLTIGNHDFPISVGPTTMAYSYYNIGDDNPLAFVSKGTYL